MDPDIPTVDFAVDHVIIQVVVARFEAGLKTAEEPFTSQRLLHPFTALRDENLDALIEQAEAQARAKWQQEQDA